MERFPRYIKWIGQAVLRTGGRKPQWKKFPSGVTFNDNPGILGEEGTAVLGRVVWDDSLPAPYLLLTIGKKMRRVDNKRIAIGPLSGPEQFDPDMRVCDVLLS